MTYRKYIILFAAITVSLTWGQTRDDANRGALPNFDLRQSIISAETQLSPRSRALVDGRTRSMEAFAAERQAAQPGIRIVPDRHGVPKLLRRDGAALSPTSTRDPDAIARDFLAANAAVYPFARSEVDQLRLVVRDVTPDATYLVFNQTLNGIDVFQGQIKFTLGKTGEVIQVGSSEVVPGLTRSTVPRLRPEDAELAARSAARAETNGTFLRAPELVIFPLDASTARLAYRLFLEVDAAQLYEILVDAEDGQLLFRHNAYVHAAQARVWTQSPSVGTRQLVTFPDGWLPALGTVTTGNNVDAFVDANGDDQPDALTTEELEGGRASSAVQMFDFTFGDGTVGLNPRNSKAAAVTNLFYFVNIAHDYYYNLGFTEAAGNFQTDNFNKGGAGGDAVRAEAQQLFSLDNASFAPTPEGTAPRLRAGLVTRGTSSQLDDLDIAYDGQVILHEYGHGVTERIVGGGTSSSCLEQIQAGALGEGWSDYFAISYFNNPVFAAYTTQNATSGLRRQSFEGYTFTYEDLGNSGYQIHDDGEIWAATLWDLRKSLGQLTTDRLVVNGLKATPCNPSMTDARDSILSADLASNGGANRPAIWTIFAKHGLGYSARGIDGTTQTGTVYDAANDLPPDLQSTKNPAISSLPFSTIVGVGELYAHTVAASNPNAGVLNFALTSGPSGMTVSPSGAIIWVAGFTAQRVKITVTDGKGGKVVHGYLIPTLTHLSPGRSISIGGSEESIGYAFIDIPSGVQIFQVTTRVGTGDPDLFVADPDGNFEFSVRDGNNETLTFLNPKPGRWRVEVDGFETYSLVSLTASFVTPILISSNTVLNNQAGVIGSETFYRVTIPPGISSFQVSTRSFAGDVDLYLKYGSPPSCQGSIRVSTGCIFDYRTENIGSIETLTVGNPASGDWYINLSAFAEYGGVSLTTSTVTAPPKPDLSVSVSHTGAITPGQADAKYTITVTNAGPGPTSDTVTVTYTPPAGLVFKSMSGVGWTCLPTRVCTRSDVLAPAGSYPPITLTVDIAASAPPSITNIVTVLGGGDVTASSNTGSDITVLVPPVITLVANAFGDTPLIAPNTWIQIKGSNLAPVGVTRIWLNPDFVNNQMPVHLDGVSVRVNGKSAYVYFISPTQVNILTPPDALSGPITVQLTNNGVTSNIATVQGQAQSLSFFEFVTPGGLHYVYGRHGADGSLIGPTSLFPGASTPVKPGESIYIAATGFGPTDVPVVSGAVTQSGNLPAPFPVVRVGGVLATVSFAGLVGVGTIQINFTVPEDVPDGDLPLTATYNGLSIQANLLITVQR